MSFFDLFSPTKYKLTKFKRKYKNKPKGKPLCIQKTEFYGKGEIICAQNVQFGYFPSPDFNKSSYIEARKDTAKINIGKNTIINNHSNIICNSTNINIGDNCIIGINFQCYDSDFHNLNPIDRKNKNPLNDIAVNIGNNVFIGNNVIVLKGITIGDNSVIGAGSVVVKSCENNSVVAGNPARVIKANNEQ